MNTFHPLVLSIGLICFLSAANPSQSETLSNEPAPRVVKISEGLPPDQDAAFKKQLADIATLRDQFNAAFEDYNKSPRSNIVVGSPQESELNNKVLTVNKARAAYISEVKKFNNEVGSANRLHAIKSMSAYAQKLGWDKEKQSRVNAALNKLALDGDPDATSTTIRKAWANILARDSDKDLAAAAAQGDGPGFPGAGTQNGQDCAVFALANATGRPYGLVATGAAEIISKAEWRPAKEKAAPEQTLSSRGLNGGEVIILAELFGQVTVVPSGDFPKNLQAGHRIAVNVIPSDGDVDSGHQIVLSKTFQYRGETWFAMMDSNQSPDKLLYLNSKELNTILQENGIMFQSEPNRTPALLRKTKE